MTNAQRFNTTKEAFNYFLKTPPVNPTTFVDWMDSSSFPEWVKRGTWVKDMETKTLHKIEHVAGTMMHFTDGTSAEFGDHIVQITIRPWPFTRLRHEFLKRTKFIHCTSVERTPSALHLYANGSFNIEWYETLTLTSPEELALEYETANHQPCGYVEFP